MALALAGCGAPPPTPDFDVIERAAQLRPADARLAELYDQSCGLCHARVGTGAPLTGDARNWGPRMRKGMEQLLRSTVAGMGAMPPGGQCAACTRQDYERLILFMADRDN